MFYQLLIALAFYSNILGAEADNGPTISEPPFDTYVGNDKAANLPCVVEGEQESTQTKYNITWYHNGKKVIFGPNKEKEGPFQLPKGGLFFIVVKRDDLGKYYCNVTDPKSKKWTVSKEITLGFAVLESDFVKNPSAKIEVAVGRPALLECDPPKGKPKPSVSWRKNGNKLELSERILQHPGGTLEIRRTERKDTGTYHCEAESAGIKRSSSPAILDVLEPPKFVMTPKNKKVEEEGTVEFKCSAVGEPKPTIFWSKKGSKMPPESRRELLSDNSLRIIRAQREDSGRYACQIKNSVGSKFHYATLEVESKPSFLTTPMAKTVHENNEVTFQCEVDGYPKPTVFWSRDNDQSRLMFPTKRYGRYFVDVRGSLIIRNVKPEDAGIHSCQAYSSAGSAIAKAKLTVVRNRNGHRLPPTITQGPQNQVVPVGQTAELICRTESTPAPQIKWLKKNKLLKGNKRIKILSSGTLQINDIRLIDSAKYTCVVSNENGASTWNATIKVHKRFSSRTNVVFNKTPEPSTFPGTPHKPIPSHITETSVTLNWRVNSSFGASPINGSIIDYFSPSATDGWIAIDVPGKKSSYVISDLKPGKMYYFIVRSKNAHGVSKPSEVSDPIKTRGRDLMNEKNKQEMDKVVTKLLAKKIINKVRAKATGSNTIRVEWTVKGKAKRYIDGFHVRFKVYSQNYNYDISQHDHAHSNNELDGEVMVRNGKTSTVLKNLEEGTLYKISVQAFHGQIHSQYSDSVNAKTHSRRPSSGPTNVRARMNSNNTMNVYWQPPPPLHRNGDITGYKIYIFGNGSDDTQSVLVPGDQDRTIVARVQSDRIYKLQMSAENEAGEGEKTKAIEVGIVPHVYKSLLKEPWFIATLIGTLGGVLWLTLCIFSIWLYRKRRERKKMGKSGVMTIPVHKVDDVNCRYTNQRAPASPNSFRKHPMTPKLGPRMNGHFDKPCGHDFHCECSIPFNHFNQMPPDITNNTLNEAKEAEQENIYSCPAEAYAPPPMPMPSSQHNTPSMKSFYKPPAPPRGESVVPYATSMLHGTPRTDHISAFRPLPGQMSDHSTGDEMTSLLAQPGGGDHGIPAPIPIGPIMNIQNIIPPPQEPPPSEMGTPPEGRGTPISVQYSTPPWIGQMSQHPQVQMALTRTLYSPRCVSEPEGPTSRHRTPRYYSEPETPPSPPIRNTAIQSPPSPAKEIYKPERLEEEPACGEDSDLDVAASSIAECSPSRLSISSSSSGQISDASYLTHDAEADFAQAVARATEITQALQNGPVVVPTPPPPAPKPAYHEGIPSPAPKPNQRPRLRAHSPPRGDSTDDASVVMTPDAPRQRRPKRPRRPQNGIGTDHV